MRFQRLVLGFQIFLAVLIAAIPFIDKNKVDSTNNHLLQDMYRFVFENNLYLTIACSAILAILSSSNQFFYPRKLTKNIRRGMMEAMLEELFGNKRVETRITVFKDAKRMRNLWIYLRQLSKFIILKARRKRFPFPKRGKYIIVWERLASEYPRSKTFFYYSTQTQRDCHGIAGMVRHNLESLVISDLPSIDDINLSEVDPQSKAKNARRVREYMALSHIKEFETLERLNRIAYHYYGDVLFDQNGEPRGGLIIDSVDTTSPFSQDIVKRLSYYVKMIGYTL